MFMEVIIYALVALAVGVVVTFLLMRLRYEKSGAEQGRIAERAAVELQMAQNELARVKGELAQTHASFVALDDEKNALLADVARLDAEKHAAEQRYVEQSEVLEQATLRCNAPQTYHLTFNCILGMC